MKPIRVAALGPPRARDTRTYNGGGGGLQDFLSKPFTETLTSGSSPGYEPQPSMLLNLNSSPDELGFMTKGRSSNVNVPFDRVLGSVNSSSELLKHNIGGKRMLPVEPCSLPDWHVDPDLILLSQVGLDSVQETLFCSHADKLRSVQEY
ncbi:hypothetical protein R6Q57_013087 [Mikania cordata]